MVLIFIFIPSSVYAQNNGSEEFTYSYDTEKTEDTPCQLSVNIEDYDAFYENVYVCLLNISTEYKYKIPLSRTNSYFDYIWLPEGTYTIEEVNTYNQLDCTFSYPEQIEAMAGVVTELHIGIIEKPTDTQDEFTEPENNEKETTSISANLNNDTQTPTQSGKYTYTHIGDGSENVSVDGEFQYEFFLDIKITTPGNPGEAKFVYSIDQKQTYSDAITIPLSGKVTIDNFVIIFDGNLEQDDEYSFFFPDPIKVLDYAYTGSLKIEVCTSKKNVYVYDIFKENNYKLLLNIKKSGAAGVAVFEYSLDGGVTYSEELLIPQNGIYEIPESDLYIQFKANSSTNEFESGTSVIVSINIKQTSNNGLVILIVLLVVALMFGYFWLLKKKKKDSDYNINRWKKIE